MIEDLHLNLGSADDYRTGFVNIDLTSKKADIVVPMEEFSPSEPPIFVLSKFSLGFLERPYEMLEKIFSWMEKGEIEIQGFEKNRAEKYIELHPKQKDRITFGQKKYGEGVIRKFWFSDKELADFFESRGCTTKLFHDGPAFRIHAFLPSKIIAKKIVWVTGYPGVGKSTLLETFTGKSNKIYHKEGKCVVVGDYSGKHFSGLDALDSSLKKHRIISATKLSEIVVYEGYPQDTPNMKKWAEENGIEFQVINLLLSEKECLKRAELRGDTTIHLKDVKKTISTWPKISGIEIFCSQKTPKEILEEVLEQIL